MAALFVVRDQRAHIEQIRGEAVKRVSSTSGARYPSRGGSVRASVSVPGKFAAGSGRLTRTAGKGRWSGHAGKDRCSGTWAAQKF